MNALDRLVVLKDKTENYLQAQYQGIHHQFVASAKVVELARTINPNFKMGTMLADCIINPFTCHPKRCRAGNAQKSYAVFLW